jgi:hypothetical protein
LCQKRPFLRQENEMLRLLKNEPKIEISKPAAEMQIRDVGICLWKEEEPNYAAQPPAGCAVCGSTEFEDGSRLKAVLNPRFEGGFRYLMAVWVHPKCFDDCIETSEPEPTAW